MWTSCMFAESQREEEKVPLCTCRERHPVMNSIGLFIQDAKKQQHVVSWDILSVPKTGQSTTDAVWLKRTGSPLPAEASVA